MLKRNSNIELLRIIAMLLVMVGHADFRAFGAPSFSDIANDPSGSFVRFLIQAASGISVNVFVLISGWFGIRVKLDKILSLLFQVFFFGSLIAIVMVLVGGGNGADLRKTATLGGSYWFVKSYLLLYMFAPLLNMFVENVSKKQLGRFLILFIAFEMYFGWLTDTKWFDYGYSPLSFMGLYLLARYLKSYWDLDTYNRYAYLITYGVVTVLVAACSMLVPTHLFYVYSSPALILASVSFLFFFCRIELKSKLVNSVAASCFAAYLLHAHPMFFDAVYIKSIVNWYMSLYISKFLLCTSLFITLLFIVSIVIDKLRLLIWNVLFGRVIAKYCR